MSTALWIASGILAAMMLVAGLTKTLRTKEQLHATGLTYVEDFPAAFVRILGIAEVLGAAGLILPGLLGIATILVPVAAVCLGITMVGAVVVHLRRGETSKLLMPIALALLAVFVAWGRFGPWPL